MEKFALSKVQTLSAASFTCSKIAPLLLCSSTRTARRLLVSPMYNWPHGHVYLYTQFRTSKARLLYCSHVLRRGSTSRILVVVSEMLTREKSLGMDARILDRDFPAVSPAYGICKTVTSRHLFITRRRTFGRGCT